MNRGWVLLHRRLFTNDLWLSEPFTKAQAWVDLFANANYEDAVFTTKKGVSFVVKRGQIAWSELTMAKRWQWDRKKVRAFLKGLQTGQQIGQRKNRITSVITILNYEEYQKTGQQSGQQTGHDVSKPKEKKERKEFFPKKISETEKEREEASKRIPGISMSSLKDFLPKI